MVLSLAVSTKISFAQDDEEMSDDEEMTEEVEMDEEEWQRQMDEYTARRNELQAQLNQLNTEIDGLRRTLADRDAQVTKAEDDLYAAVGSTKSGVADFRRQFEEAERRINACKGPDDAASIRTSVYNTIAASKIRCLPEFWDRFQAMTRKLDSCGTAAPTPGGQYTVVKGDCLWKIAGMTQHYGNPRLWPAIWEANRDGVVSAPARVPKTIRNPNLIYPGQVLRIPALTEAEKTAAMNKSMNYRRPRKNRMTKTTNTTTDTNKDMNKDMKKDEKKDTKK